MGSDSTVISKLVLLNIIFICDKVIDWDDVYDNLYATNESMQKETTGEDGHTSHTKDDMEIADCTKSTQEFSSPTTSSHQN